MNIYESINAIMREIPAIGKKKKNAQQGYAYRGIDDVVSTLQPLLSKHNVFVIPQVLEQHREERQAQRGGNLIYSICKVKYTFFAEDGSSVEATVIGEGMDSGDKATNKAMSAAFKYALFQVFSIPTEEMKDPDAVTPENSKPAKKNNEPAPIMCSRCGKEIKAEKDKKGKTLTPAQIAGVAQQKHGCVLCGDCMRQNAPKEAGKAAERGNNVK